MHLFTLQLLNISTSLLAWITISSSFFIQLQYYKKKLNTTTHILPLLFVLWIIITYTLYEVFLLCQSSSVMSSFNCWSLTLLTPFIYLYYKSQITGSLSGRKVWLRHLLIPGILALVYIVMPFITSVTDQQIYSWTEFKLNHPTWWTIFRISCYLICIIQLSIYTIYLKRIIKEHESKAKFKNGKIILILCICVVYFISNLMAGYIFDILFYLTTIMLGGYIIWNKKISRIIMHELKSIFPRIANLPTHSKRVPQLNEKQKDAVFIWLHKPDNSKSKVNLKILAKEILINPATLSKFFKEEIGGSFANYIASQRLDNFEKSLLDNKQDDKSVIEKAEETGFQSSASFYRAFLKRHQVSPLKWKEQILNETRQTDNS